MTISIGTRTYVRPYVVPATGQAGSLSNFPIPVYITNDTVFGAHAKPDGSDIVFSDGSGNLLPYEWDLPFSITGGYANGIAHVTFPSYPTGAVTLYSGYGTSLNTSALFKSAWPNTWDSNFQAVYHCSQAGGATILDSTSFGRNLSSNNLLSGSGQINKGFYTTGGGQAGQPASNPAITGSGAFTMSGWFKAPSFPTYFGGGFSFGTNATGEGAYLGSVGNFWGGGIFASVNLASAVATLNAYVHLAIRYAGGTNGAINLHVNGGSPFYTGTLTAGIAYGGVFINALCVASYFQFSTIYVDELRLSSVDRGADWIKAEYSVVNNPGVWGTETAGYLDPGITNVRGAVAGASPVLYAVDGNPLTGTYNPTQGIFRGPFG